MIIYASLTRWNIWVAAWLNSLATGGRIYDAMKMTVLIIVDLEDVE